MKINSIEWHEDNLKNYISYLERKIKEYTRLEKSIIELQQQIDFKKFQIKKAIKEKKETFDADRYCHKRKKDESK